MSEQTMRQRPIDAVIHRGTEDLPTSTAVHPISGRLSVTQQTARDMQQRILSGDWPEGFRLPPQRELCEELGVSRTALREATTTLEALGFLSVEVGRGVFVTERGKWRSDNTPGTGKRYTNPEIIQARYFLESWAAQLATNLLDDSEIKQLAALVDDMEQALARQKIAELDILDAKFHQIIAQRCGNQMIVDLMEIVGAAYAQRERQHTITVDDKLVVISRRVAEHRRILKALQDRDPVEAFRAMQAHIAGVAARNGISLPKPSAQPA